MWVSGFSVAFMVLGGRVFVGAWVSDCLWRLMNACACVCGRGW